MSNQAGVEADVDGRATPTSVSTKVDDLTIDIPLANHQGGQQGLLQQRKKREDAAANAPSKSRLAQACPCPSTLANLIRSS